MATPIPGNWASFTRAELVEATGAVASGSLLAAVRGVTTDSREDVSGKLFVALSGERFDGHTFLEDVARRGAAAVLVEREVELSGPAVFRVSDTLEALGGIARYHRRRWGRNVIAIGGSAGKTTTRSVTSAALEALSPGRIHSTTGNLNNRIGVPMVLLGLTSGHDHCVVEVGTNLRGEVAALTSVTEPDTALVTLVDLEHAEGIGNLDAVELEEGDLLEGARRTAIVNGDDDRACRQLVRAVGARRVTYGTRLNCTYRLAERRSLGVRESELVLQRPGADCITLRVPLIGHPAALAVTAALAIASEVTGGPIHADRFREALQKGPLGEPGRARPVELGNGVLVLDDTYNANPASVRAAVVTAGELARARGGRLLLALGEMRELGAFSAEEHQALGSFVAESGASFLLAIAGDAKLTAESARFRGLVSEFSTDAEACIESLAPRLHPADVLLVKASRGVRAERIVSHLVARFGTGANAPDTPERDPPFRG